MKHWFIRGGSFIFSVAVVIACNTSDDSANDTENHHDTGTDSAMNDSEGSTDTPQDSSTGSDVGADIGVTPEEALAQMESGAHVVVVDVSPYYDEGHIPGSINLYVGGYDIDNALPYIDKSFTYIIYCHSDVASMLGAQKFIDGGFPNVYRIVGNYGAWVAAGFDVQKTSDGYMDVNVATAKVLMDGKSDVSVVDVSPYFDAGHLPGALNYPLGDGSLAGALETLNDSDTYLVYCHGDAPSISGAELLFDAGFSPVYRLVGNYSAWVTAGFPVE